MAKSSRRLGLAAMVLAGLVSLAPGAAPPSTSPERQKVLAFNSITGMEPLLGEFAVLSRKPKEAKKLVAAAAALAKERHSRLGRHVTLMMAMLADSLKQTEASLALYQHYARQSVRVQSDRGLATAYIGMISANFDAKRYAEAEKLSKQILTLESEERDDTLERAKPGIFRRMVLAIARRGHGERALKTIEAMIKAEPRNWLHRALKAVILREMDRYPEAAKTYLDIIDRLSKDDRLNKNERQEFADDYRYTLSGVYVEMNQIDKAVEQLKILLEHSPDNATYHNDLGFIWADHNMNLPESERLIRRAIELDRKQRGKGKADPKGFQDNSAYLDSLGWVLFKQGKAKEARPHLLAAVKDPEGQHIEIFDHLADVHWKLGEKAEAIAAWKQGLEHATDSKRDQKRKEIVQKKLKMAQGG